MDEVGAEDEVGADSHAHHAAKLVLRDFIGDFPLSLVMSFTLSRQSYSCFNIQLNQLVPQ